MRLEREARELRARLDLTVPMVKQEEEGEEKADESEEEKSALTANDSANSDKSHDDHDMDGFLLRVSEAETIMTEESISPSSFSDVHAEDANNVESTAPSPPPLDAPLIKCLFVRSFFPALALHTTFNRI
jgi:hypothetical protein